MLSDARTHENPAVTGFSTLTGSAPDYNVISATGGPFCVNDINFTLTMSGSTAPTCYQLTVQTNSQTLNCTTNGAGTCNITSGSGSYGDGSTILVRIQKTCNLPTKEGVNYTVSGHI